MKYGQNLWRANWPALSLALMLALLLVLAPSAALAQDSDGDVTPAAADGKINNNILEFGVWWVEDYPPAGAGGSDLPATRPDALGLRDYLTSDCKTRIFGICFTNWSSPQWTARFVYGNTSAWSTDWRRSANGGSENSYIDTIDLAYFAGHGSTSGIIFGVGSPTPVTVSKNDALNSWGDRDLDWIGLAACNVLDDPVSNLQGWGEAMNGVRLILGFKTVMNDVAHGVEFGKAIRDGYTFTQAWFRAADKLQSQNRVARVLAEQQAYFDDRPAQHNANTVVDWPKYYLTHAVGSEPARFVDAAAINYQMPVLKVQPLSLDESLKQADTLGAAFGVTVSVIISGEIVDIASSLGGELEMDVANGLFLHTDTANLWKTESELSVMAASGAAMQAIDNNAAKRIADAFLQQNGLTREDAQFFEVATDTLTTMDQVVTASGETVVTLDERITNYQVIYSRIFIYSPSVSAGAVTQPVEFSVMGPGSKFKIYVAAEAPVSASAADLARPAAQGGAVLGGMGGYRRLQVNPQAAAGGQVELVSMLPETTITKLFQHLEKHVALDLIPLAPQYLVGREIVSMTPAYWEGPMGFGQTELIPVYALEVKNTLSDTENLGSTYVVSSTTYIPVEPGLMAPLARISTTADLNAPVAPGATIVFEALDASKTLVELGLDPDPSQDPLNFVLGSGEVTYTWYLNEVSDETKLGTGRILNYVGDPTKDFEGKDGGLGAQRIVLVVEDTGKDSEPKTSQAVVTLQSVPPLYLPAVQR
jgi:hypothetical protein